MCASQSASSVVCSVCSAAVVGVPAASANAPNSVRSTASSARRAAMPSACEMPHSSISALVAEPTDHASAHCCSGSYSASRRRSVSIFESAR